MLALPFGDHVLHSPTAQLNLILEQALEAFAHIDIRVRLHLAGADSANAARSVNCWTRNLTGRLSHEFPHAGAVKDLLAERARRRSF